MGAAFSIMTKRRPIDKKYRLCYTVIKRGVTLRRRGAVATNEGRFKELAHSLACLSQDIEQGAVPDASVLNDLKLTVDQLRLTLWAVITYEKQTKYISRAGLQTKLAEFRMKRLTEMLRELQTDIMRGLLVATPSELQDLTSALQNTLQNLTPVHKAAA
jgi:hypothetical protein